MTNRPKKTEFREGRGYSKQDWEAIDFPELSDEEMARVKPAREVLPPEFFSAIEDMRRARGRPRVENPKQAVTLRLDAETLARFKAAGKDWRTRMAEALAAAKP